LPRLSNIKDLPQPSRQSNKHPPTYYKLDAARFLVLRHGGNGLNNQLQCLNLAANLAIAYNRTLLVGPNAYTGSYHSPDAIRFEDLFDLANVKLSIKIVATDADLPHPTVRVKFFDPEKPFQNDLMLDPNPAESHVTFSCTYGGLHHNLPPNNSHRDELLLPFHPTYVELAHQVLDEIQTRVHTSSLRTNFRLLGMHVRRGDLKGYPVFECSETTAFPYLRTFQQGGWWLAACTDKNVTTHAVPVANEVLSWDQVFRQLQHCGPEIPLCADDYDAIFVATNDVAYVTALGIPNLFVLDHFPFVKETLCQTQCHKIKEFVVEELILALSTTYQPSAPSSITDMILHLRLNAHESSAQDVRLYQIYDNIERELRSARKGDIINWENMANLANEMKAKH
jgi:hypothetical protein